MKNQRVVMFAVLCLAFSGILLAFGAASATAPLPEAGAKPGQGKRVDILSKLPLTFEMNQGQTSGEVKFLSHGPGYPLFLTRDEAVLGLRLPPTKHYPPTTSPSSFPSSTNSTAAFLRLKLLGANPQSTVSGLGELAGKSSYFMGNDPRKWRTHIKNFGRVRCQNIYPGIDLVYYGRGHQLEHDFIVHPGARTDTIRMALSGAGAAHIDSQGNLQFIVGGGKITLKKPAIYQEIRGARRCIQGGYLLNPDWKEATRPRINPISQISPHPHRLPAVQLGFSIGSYNHSYPLIIDPILAYSTYFGGSDLSSGSAITVDTAGKVYVTGSTSSMDFPTTAGAFQPGYTGYFEYHSGWRPNAFVTKFDMSSSGTVSLVYSTYLGGINSENGTAIAVDQAGNAYITGSTDSSDFPTAGAFQNTFGGGAELPQSYGGYPTDAFVTKLDPTGSILLYSSYLGGNSFDSGNGIATDNQGKVYITGSSASSNFPTTPGSFQENWGAIPFNPNVESGPADAFVTKIDTTRVGAVSLVYSTYLGGSGTSSMPYGPGSGLGSAGGDIAVDAAGSAYIAGTTAAADFPTTAGAFQPAFGGYFNDAFLAKLDATGSHLLYSTFLGGNNFDVAQAIALDSAGMVYVAGVTFSSDFPTTPGALQPASQSVTSGDGFVVKLDTSRGGAASLIYATYLGGTGYETINKIAVDIFGNAYVTGLTLSQDFPTTRGSLQQQLNQGIVPFRTSTSSSYDAFVSKIDATGSRLLFSTYLGGARDDVGNGIAVDGAGSIYVTGATSSSDFPTTPGSIPRTAMDYNSTAFITRIIPAPQPAALTAVPGPAQILINWTPVPDADSYTIKRSNTAGGPWTTIATGVVSTSYLDSNLTRAVPYYYIVTAVNGNGESPDSNEASATPILPLWLALDIAAAQNNSTEILWTNTHDNSITIWTVGANNSVLSSWSYGPYTDWSATAIAADKQANTYVLWSNISGQAAVQVIAPNGSFNSFAYGPYPGWRAAALAVDTSSHIHLLWNHTSGEVAAWTLNLDGTGQSGYNYGPYPGWRGVSLSVDGRGMTYLLWSHTSGQMAVYLLEPDLLFRSGYNYGPYNGWRARSIRVDAVGSTRLLWTNDTGEEALWRLDANGGFQTGYNYGPYANWVPTAISPGPDGSTRLLWDNFNNGQIALWRLSAEGVLLGGYNYMQ